MESINQYSEPHAESVAGPWVRRTVEFRLIAARRERDELIEAIDEHRRQIEWRQSAVETLIEEIEELSTLLNDGSEPAGTMEP